MTLRQLLFAIPITLASLYSCNQKEDVDTNECKSDNFGVLTDIKNKDLPLTFTDVKAGSTLYDSIVVDTTAVGALEIAAFNNNTLTLLADKNFNDNPETYQFGNANGLGPKLKTIDCLCDDIKAPFFVGTKLALKAPDAIQQKQYTVDTTTTTPTIEVVQEIENKVPTPVDVITHNEPDSSSQGFTITPNVPLYEQLVEAIENNYTAEGTANGIGFKTLQNENGAATMYENGAVSLFYNQRDRTEAYYDLDGNGNVDKKINTRLLDQDEHIEINLLGMENNNSGLKQLLYQSRDGLLFEGNAENTLTAMTNLYDLTGEEKMQGFDVEKGKLYNLDKPKEIKTFGGQMQFDFERKLQLFLQ